MYSDNELVAGCKKGDPLIQEALYKKYASAMRYICQRYARTSFEVEDIFQESFVKVLTNIQKYNGSGSLDGWIRRVFINSSIDYCKKNLKWNDHRPLLDGDGEYKEGEEEEPFITNISEKLSKEDLLEIVNSLPDGYRMVFNLFAIEGYSHLQVSEALNISVGTSKSQLAKARKMLKMLICDKLIQPSNDIKIKLEDGELKLDVSA